MKKLGSFNSLLQPIVRVECEGSAPGNEIKSFPFIVDTGYTGDLSLDMETVRQLGMTGHVAARAFTTLTTARGKVPCKTCILNVHWNDVLGPFQAYVTDMNLIGCGLLRGCTVKLPLHPDEIVEVLS